MNNMKYGFLILITALATVSAQAAGRISGSGNGGDMCELRMKDIRQDLSNWIALGGAQGLRLPQDVSVDQYITEMQAVIGSAKFSCVDETLKIGSAEKTCVNYKNDDKSMEIVCNTKRFLGTTESNQYVLTHHEFAGLAGFEVNSGEESNYTISNQITGFLEDHVVKKLVIKNTVQSRTLLSCRNGYSGGFTATVANGWARFSIYRDGYFHSLQLAEELGLSPQDEYDYAEFMIPESKCRLTQQGGYFNCQQNNIIVTFKNRKGDVYPIQLVSLDIGAGVIGVGSWATQRIEISARTATKNVHTADGYKASYTGGEPGYWSLCDRIVE